MNTHLFLPHSQPSKVFEKCGIKIGVIGYLTPDNKKQTIPNDVEFLDEINSIRYVTSTYFLTITLKKIQSFLPKGLKPKN
jgi:hypothetical protein